MSAAARGAAGYLYASGRLRRRKDLGLSTLVAKHLRRFVSTPERAQELAAEAATVRKRR